MLLQPGKKNQNKSGEIYFVKPQFIVLKDPKGFAALEWAMRQDASDQACCTIDISQLSTLSFFGFLGNPESTLVAPWPWRCSWLLPRPLRLPRRFSPSPRRRRPTSEAPAAAAAGAAGGPPPPRTRRPRRCTGLSRRGRPGQRRRTTRRRCGRRPRVLRRRPVAGTVGWGRRSPPGRCRQR